MAGASRERRQSTHPCRANEGKEGACHTAKNRAPLSLISGLYPTAHNFKSHISLSAKCQIRL